MLDRAVFMREIPHSRSSFKNDENEKNLDCFKFVFFLYLGVGIYAQVTAYKELRYWKDCTPVSYGLYNQE